MSSFTANSKAPAADGSPCCRPRPTTTLVFFARRRTAMVSVASWLGEAPDALYVTVQFTRVAPASRYAGRRATDTSKRTLSSRAAVVAGGCVALPCTAAVVDDGVVVGMVVVLGPGSQRPHSARQFVVTKSWKKGYPQAGGIALGGAVDPSGSRMLM